LEQFRSDSLAILAREGDLFDHMPGATIAEGKGAAAAAPQ
jgi:hypothetical protein